MPHLLTAVICLMLAAVLERTERVAWHHDPSMLRSSGFFIGLAAAFVAMAIFN